MAVSRDKILKGAEKLVLKGKIEPAIREYEKLLKLNPNDVNTINRIGDLYNRVGQVDKAVELYERIADSFTADGFSNKAIAIYKKINRLAPDRVEIFKKLADLYIQQGLIFEAKSQYQILADWFSKNDDFENAIQVQRELVQIDSDNHMAHLRLADLLFRQDNGQEAIEVYDRLGSMLLEGGKLEEAERLYRHAVEQNPPSGEFLTPICESLISNGNLKAAGEFLAAARKRSPDSRELRIIAVRLALASGDNERALTGATTLLEEFSGDSEIGFLAGKTHLACGNSEDAKKLLMSAAESRIADGSSQEAQEIFQSLITTLPQDEDVLELGTKVLDATKDGDFEFTLKAALADGFYNIGNSGKARQMYSQLLLQDTGNNLFKSRLKELEVGGAPLEVSESVIDAPPGRAESGAQPQAEPQDVHADHDFDDDPEIIEIEIPDELPIGAVGGDVPVFDDAEAQEKAGFDPQERLAEATVFSKYGLIDKAIHHLERILEFFPEHDLAREKLVLLAIEAGQGDLAAQHAPPLVEKYRETVNQAGLDSLAQALPQLGLQTGTEPDAIAAEEIGDEELIVEIDEDLGAPSFDVESDIVGGSDDVGEVIEFLDVGVDDFEGREFSTPEEDSIEFVALDEPEICDEDTDHGVRVQEIEASEKPVDQDDFVEVPESDELHSFDVEPISAVDSFADDASVEPFEEPDFSSPAFDAIELDDVVEHEEAEEVFADSSPDLPDVLESGPSLGGSEEIDFGFDTPGEAEASMSSGAEEVPAATPSQGEDVLGQLAALEQSVLSGAEPETGSHDSSGPSPDTMADTMLAEAVKDLRAPSVVDLEQLDSFVEMSLYEDATRLLGRLDSEYPHHPEVTKRRMSLKSKGVLMDDVPRSAEASEDLFSDEEEEYVDLAAELEEEMAAEEAIVEEAAGSKDGEAELEEVFREFQKGVAEQLSEEDSDTHFNLGIAYKEMGLLPEAIREFQISSRSPDFFVECCSMIGVCYVEQGLWEQAASWYSKALESPDLAPESSTALKYDLATALESGGDSDRAIEVFEEIMGVDPAFRDVLQRLENLSGHRQAN